MVSKSQKLFITLGISLVAIGLLFFILIEQIRTIIILQKVKNDKDCMKDSKKEKQQITEIFVCVGVIIFLIIIDFVVAFYSIGVSFKQIINPPKQGTKMQPIKQLELPQLPLVEEQIQRPTRQPTSQIVVRSKIVKTPAPAIITPPLESYESAMKHDVGFGPIVQQQLEITEPRMLSTKILESSTSPAPKPSSLPQSQLQYPYSSPQTSGQPQAFS